MSPRDSIATTDEVWARFLPSNEEMAAFDSAAIASGTLAADLMEKAGAAVAQLIIEWFSSEFGPEHPVVVLCGPGNNGGDGMVIARHLREKGASVSVVVMHAARYSPELTAQIGAYMRTGQSFSVFAEQPETLQPSEQALNRETLQTLLDEASLIIEALLGAGQREAPRGAIAAAIECVRKSQDQSKGGVVCIAVDIPAGIDGSTGRVFEPHISADITIAIELVKRGLVQYPARAECGRILAVPVGIACDTPTEFCFIDDQDTSLKLPERRPDAHKGDAGKVVVIGGSPKLPGAAVLSCQAALRMGAGLVVQTVFGNQPSLVRPAEIMYEPFDGQICVDYLPRLCELMRTAQCVVLGPGVGTGEAAIECLVKLLHVISNEKIPAVIDADALTALAVGVQQGEKFDLSSAVLTPHPGEMGRLLGVDKTIVQSDRYGAARTLADAVGAVIVLKGAGSITYARERGLVNTTGTPAMATAGSGDVLSGMIGGLIAQGMDPARAAVTGVLFHGLAGEEASRQNGGPIMASDIISSLPAVFKQRAELEAA